MKFMLHASILSPKFFIYSVTAIRASSMSTRQATSKGFNRLEKQFLACCLGCCVFLLILSLFRDPRTWMNSASLAEDSLGGKYLPLFLIKNHSLSLIYFRIDDKHGMHLLC